MMMRTFRIRTGFQSIAARVYEGENIIRVKETREISGDVWHLLEDDQWIREAGPDMFITDWNSEECWGCVEDVTEGEPKELGYIILKVDRERGLRILGERRHTGMPGSAPPPDDSAMKNPEKKLARNRKDNQRFASVDPALCRGCRICAKACPVCGIHISDHKAHISQDCIGCGECVGLCPFRALSCKIAPA
jgi:ferredoxin